MSQKIEDKINAIRPSFEEFGNTLGALICNVIEYSHLYKAYIDGTPLDLRNLHTGSVYKEVNSVYEAIGDGIEESIYYLALILNDLKGGYE